MKGNPAMPGGPLTSKPAWPDPERGLGRAGFFFACLQGTLDAAENRLLGVDASRASGCREECSGGIPSGWSPGGMGVDAGLEPATSGLIRAAFLASRAI